MYDTGDAGFHTGIRYPSFTRYLVPVFVILVHLGARMIMHRYVARLPVHGTGSTRVHCSRGSSIFIRVYKYIYMLPDFYQFLSSSFELLLLLISLNPRL